MRLLKGFIFISLFVCLFSGIAISAEYGSIQMGNSSNITGTSTSHLFTWANSTGLQDVVTRSQMITGDQVQLNKSGGTMTGQLTIPVPTATTSTARQDTVNAANVSAANLYVAKSGSTWTGSMNANGKFLNNSKLGGSGSFVTIGPNAWDDYVTTGTADQTKFAQAIADGHRYLKLDAGTFVFSDVWYLNLIHNIKIEGAGANSTYIDATGCSNASAIYFFSPQDIDVSGFTLMRTTHTDGKVGITIEGSWGMSDQVFNHILVTGFDTQVSIGRTSDIWTQGAAVFNECWFGLPTATASGSHYGVVINYDYLPVFENCHFRDFTVAGIKCIRCDSLTAINNEIITAHSTTGVGILLDPTETNSNSGGTPMSNRVADAKIIGNQFELMAAGIVAKNNTFGCTFDNNWFYSTGNAVVCKGYAGYTMHDIIISRCRMSNIGVGNNPYAAGDYGGIRIENYETSVPAHDFVVSNNLITVDAYGVRLYSAGAVMHKVTVTGNTFVDRAVRSNPWDVTLDSVDRSTITGNTFQTTTYGTAKGLWMSSGSDHNVVIGNGGIMSYTNSGASNVVLDTTNMLT